MLIEKKLQTLSADPGNRENLSSEYKRQKENKERIINHSWNQRWLVFHQHLSTRDKKDFYFRIQEKAKNQGLRN